MTQRLPNPDLVRRLLDLDGDDIVWRLTRRKATVPALFEQKTDVVLIGWLAAHADDVRHVLATGEWPQQAFERSEFHVRREQHQMQFIRMDRETARAEQLAAQELEVA